MQYAFTFKTFYLKEIHKTIMIFHEIANELIDVAKLVNFKIILTKESKKVLGHERGLL